MIVLKILAAPAVAIFTLNCNISFCIAASICYAACMVGILLLLLFSIINHITGCIVFLVLAFLLSPFGVPAVAEWSVNKIHGCTYALWDFIMG